MTPIDTTKNATPTKVKQRQEGLTVVIITYLDLQYLGDEVVEYYTWIWFHYL